MIIDTGATIGIENRQGFHLHHTARDNVPLVQEVQRRLLETDLQVTEHNSLAELWDTLDTLGTLRRVQV